MLWGLGRISSVLVRSYISNFLLNRFTFSTVADDHNNTRCHQYDITYSTDGYVHLSEKYQDL